MGFNTTDCSVAGGTDPGLNSDCTPQGSSDFGTPIIGVTLANSFWGKVTEDDATNGSDISGAADYPVSPANFDWARFDNPYRSWGLEGLVFPDTSNQGQWTTGAGRIWDWSLLSTDTVVRDVLTLPTGDNTLTQIWSGTPATNDDAGCNTLVAGSVWNPASGICQTIFLRNATEILGDSIGNDNGLCESNETCLYTPNIGSYQGHGTLISAGAFKNGVLTGVTLLMYSTNGR